MKNTRLVRIFVLFTGLLLIAVIFACQGPGVTQQTPSASTAPPPAGGAVVTAVPARAGAVDGTTQNSDEFIWNLFTQVAAPVDQSKQVLFETWASDADTFSLTPHWPGPNEPKKFQRSILDAATSPAHGSVQAALDVPCNPPGNPGIGGFPTTGSPTPCIAEEVRRNRPEFDYIVNNNLNTQVGLAAAYKKNYKVAMPTTAVTVKGDWVPVKVMLQWLPQLKDAANIEKLYYTSTSAGVEYALVGLAFSSRQNTNWVWATLEHQMNPGRCDTMGCFDTFGAVIPVVKPNLSAANTQYGACAKTPALQALLTKAGLSPVWENYCLKSTMVDYAAADGTPYVLGNSVVERINANVSIYASSCISCHAYASFGETGAVGPGPLAMLGNNPTGSPLAGPMQGSMQFDFSWGVLAAPAPPATPTPTPTPKP